ncbi:MAG: GNAT family N-acetyltransferase [Ruminiclostridium sp.]|jgi:hypothetical protein|nr:GNAT family N-acetyltransferase [Ruminiclostridium sp.]
MEFEHLTFTPMVKEDIPLLTPIMKRCFDNDSQLFFQKPAGGPPGYDDGSFLEEWGFNPEATSYRIDLKGTPIGAIILFIHEEHGSGFLGNIFIDTDLSGNGYGSTAWRFVEHMYPKVKTWYAETPAVSYRNHYFYTNKCGFHIVAVEGGRNRFEAQFKLCKTINHMEELA